MSEPLFKDTLRYTDDVDAFGIKKKKNPQPSAVFAGIDPDEPTSIVLIQRTMAPM